MSIWVIDGWSISYKNAFMKLPSDQCHWNLLKINPTLVQVHLMTWCLYYTVVWSDRGCRPVGNQSAISWGAIGNRLAIGRRLVGDCISGVRFWWQKVCNFLKIGQQPIGDQSATKTVSGLSATAATGRQSVANQSATSWQPVGDH